MINRDRIDSLKICSGGNHPVISMYVNVEWPKKYASRLNSLVRKKIQHIHEKSRFPGKEIEAMEKLLFRMESDLKRRKNRFPGVSRRSSRYLSAFPTG